MENHHTHTHKSSVVALNMLNLLSIDAVITVTVYACVWSVLNRGQSEGK